jgi:hypothetical protein
MHARFRWLALCWLLPLLLIACQATTAPAPALRFGVVSSWPGFTPFFLAAQATAAHFLDMSHHQEKDLL